VVKKLGFRLLSMVGSVRVWKNNEIIILPIVGAVVNATAKGSVNGTTVMIL